MIMFRATILILVLSILFASCATTKTPLPTDNIDELLGTWVNPDYPKINAKSWFPQKIVIKPGPTYEIYNSRFDLVPLSISTFTLTAKWIDSEGNVLYKMIWKFKGKGDPRYEMGKINNQDQTWEFINSYDDYPTEVDANHPEYHIYYRQK